VTHFLSVVGHLLTSLVDRVGGELKGELTKLLGTVVETVVVGLLVTVVVGLVTVVVGLLVGVVVGLRVTVVGLGYRCCALRCWAC
jgi:hypothetical protein